MDRILIVDDDEELCELVAEYLRPEGFEVQAVHSGIAGIERGLSGEHVLIVLDVMLPGTGGFEVLRRIRTASRIPVLMLTARGDDVDRIVGLEIGADDYLRKPFNPRELVARIHAILRRTRPEMSDSGAGAAHSSSTQPPLERFVVGDVELDKGTRVVKRGGETVDLTVVEFDLLAELLQAAGRVVPREELVRTVLGRGHSPFDRSIDMHVSRIRKKLGPHADQTERIKTVRGVGYIYTKESEV